MLEDRPLFPIRVAKTAGLSLPMIFAGLCGFDRLDGACWDFGTGAPADTAENGFT